MYYPESDILLRSNPEYKNDIVKLDKLLGSMGQNEGKQLKKEVISDLTGVKIGIIEFIFDYYCKMKILEIKKYLICPEEFSFLDEINDECIEKFPIKEFCDICGIEHVFTKDNLAFCYILKRNADNYSGEKANHTCQRQSINGEIALTDDSIGKNTDSINLENFFISKETKNVIKIATVQIDYKLSEKFPFEPLNKNRIKEKFELALKKSVDLGVDIICFSELCFCEEWLKDIEENYPNIAIIPGTYYDGDNHNICTLLIDHATGVPSQMKIKPSESENPIITGIGMVSGDKIYIYETKFGKISILICRDFGNFIENLSNKIDILFVPSYNENIDRFEEIAHTYVQNHPSYIIISNSAIFGGTSIFGQIDKVHFSQLVQAGCKENESNTYKLCEIKKGSEGIIVADFNIKYKSIQKPAPIDPSEATRSVTNIRKYDI
jgi:predicted amidohydrolase